tara:strand:+ start:23 stop:2284 length:2262 start_codon:yes stop_codon:yes gene_type:complete
MATHDYIISNGTGSVIRADINNALSAIVSNNSSNSEPATKYAYMWWADTSAGLLKIRNSANDAWITLFQLDGTLTLEDGSNSAPAISFRDDDNTGIFSSAADNLDITTGGTTRVNVSSTGINVTGTVTDDGATHDGDVTFTGASANIIFDKSDNALEFADTSLARFGNSNDLAIYHSGSQSFIQDAGTGGLFVLGSRVEIGNSGGSESGLVFIQNGSVDLYYDNSKKFETTSTGVAVTGGLSATSHITLPDDVRLKVGTGEDLHIYHNQSNSVIREEGTGNLNIQTTGGNVEVLTNTTETSAKFISNGAVELYYDNTKRLETTSSGIKVTGTTTTGSEFLGDFRVKGTDDSNFVTFKPSENLARWHDNDKAVFGGSNDLQIYHDGTDSFITNSTGDLDITNTGDDINITAIDDIRLKPQNGEQGVTVIGNGAVELYYDNSKRLRTDQTGIVAVGPSSTDATINMQANAGSTNADLWKLTASASSSLFTLTNNASGSTETNLKAVGNGAVELYYDNVKKFETTSDGAKVTDSDTIVHLALETSSGIAGYLFGGGNDQIALVTSQGNSEFAVRGVKNAQTELYYDNNKKLETTSFGCTVQGGITFGSDTAAANQLDDYEEGVFTPSLEFGGATTGITYSSMRAGSYTKIGRQVTVNFGFTLTSKGSASGDATLAGLPFAVEDIISGTSVEASGVSSFWNDVATDSANIVFAATNSSSELQIRHTVGAEDDTDDMTEGDFENNTALRGSITYFTAT